MTDTIFLQVKGNRRITIPADFANKDDLLMIKKVTRVEMDNFFLNLQKTNAQKIIDSMPNEIHGINE